MSLNLNFSSFLVTSLIRLKTNSGLKLKNAMNSKLASSLAQLYSFTYMEHHLVAIIILLYFWSVSYTVKKNKEVRKKDEGWVWPRSSLGLGTAVFVRDGGWVWRCRVWVCGRGVIGEGVSALMEQVRGR